MAAPLLSLRDVGLRYGAHPLFRELTLHIQAGDKISLIGRNGTGKSTLMKVIAGMVESDSGERFVKPGTSVAYLPQEPDASGYATLRDYIVAGLPASMADEDYRADVLIDGLMVRADASPEAASGGELRRAALARVMISEPDLLLLDEPTNHLDLKTILWLEETLSARQGAMVLISHDRAFLQRLTEATFWLDRGQVRRFDGSFDKVDAWQDELLEAERVEHAKLDKKIAEESRWAVEGISARRKRNQGRLRRLYEMRSERRERVLSPGNVEMGLSSGQASGTKVIEAKGVSKAYEGRELFSEFSTRIHRGDRVGILGPNGAGKSTLLKILTGELEADSGSVKLGTALNPLMIDQKRASLKPDMTVRDVLTGGRGDYVHKGDETVHVMTYMKEFLFSTDQANTPVDALSGGERGRLLLAAGFAKPSNLLVLDEPTNDLDMDTLDLLVDVLAGYDGTLILVSHDRDFLDRTVTSTIVLEGDGTAIEYAGGYSDYRTQRQADDPATNVVKLKPKKDKPREKKKAAKLSYKDQRALDMLPAEIEDLNTKAQLMEAEMADPALYSKNPERFNKLTKELEELQNLVEEKEMQWLELEELKDSLENGS